VRRWLAERFFGVPPEADFRTDDEVRSLVWPPLRATLESSGFAHFRRDSAWRVLAFRTDVLETQFEEMPRRIPGNPQSPFTVNFGSHFPFLPATDPASQLHQVPGEFTPSEFLCPLRNRLARSWHCDALQRFPEVWCLELHPPPLQELLDNLLRAVTETALPILDAIASPAELLRTLRAPEAGIGLGTPGSPRRNYLIGFTALEAGEVDLAIGSFRAFLAQLGPMLAGFDHEAAQSPLWLQKLAVERVLRELAA
jgi:hypothetical protein